MLNITESTIHEIDEIENKFVLFDKNNKSLIHFNNQKIEEKNLRNFRFLYLSTLAAFNIDSKQCHIFDPFHDIDQYSKLFFKNSNEYITSIKESRNKIDDWNKKNIIEENFRILSEFANDNFRILIKEEQNKCEIQSKKNLLLSKCHIKKLKISSQILKFNKRISADNKNIYLNQKQIMKKYKIGKKKAKICIDSKKCELISEQINSEIEIIFKEREHENNLFINFFNEIKNKFKTKKQIFNDFLLRFPNSTTKSLSSFHRKYFLPNKIKFKKIKLQYSQKNTEKRDECRLLFIVQLMKLIRDNKKIYFFDESTFELKSKIGFGYSYSGIKPICHCKPTPIFLRMMMIVSFDGIESIHLTFEKVKGNDVFLFLRNFLIHVQKKPDFTTSAISLILDNCPKNRTKQIKGLADKKLINFFYTVPCSPFLNMIESVFNLIKRKIQTDINYPFK